MALIKTSGTISDIRGKIGGAIFANSGAGLSIRSFRANKNKNTLTQNNQRINIAILQREWQNLSNDQRDKWRLWTKQFPIKQKRNTEKFLNAQQTYIKINAPFMSYGHSRISNPVFAPSILGNVQFTVLSALNNLVLFFNRVLDNSQEFVEFYATTEFPVTVNNPGTVYKLIKFTTPNSNNVNISLEYYDVFGILPRPGARIFWKARLIDKISGLSQSQIKGKHTISF